jgi:Protein of unknown function (DUF2955)
VNRGDKAALRLAIGLGLAVLVAYGMALPVPYVVCVMSVLVLSRPGPPLPLVKGLVLALLIAVLVATGIVMVPLLEHYAFAAVLMTAVVLHSIFFVGLTSGNPLTAILVLSFTLIPVAGVAEQALVGRLSLTLAVGVSVGVLVSAVSHSLFPDPPAPAAAAGAAARVSPDEAAWIALRATLIVMPVFVLALTDPSFYLAAVMKTVALAQQAGETDARSAGRELVGATLMGAAIAAAVWTGLSIWPSLWMLMLWLMAASLWIGSAMFGVRRTKWRPSFWSNALITTFLLLGPAIEDSASGKSVVEGSVMRVCLFVGVALYAWSTIRLLERFRPGHPPGDPVLHRQQEETT